MILVVSRLLVVLGVFSVVLVPSLRTMAHGGDIEVVAEVASHTDGYEYGLSIHWSDGDPVSGAHIVMRADQGDRVEVAEPVEVSPGVYVGLLRLGSLGEWQVAVAIHHPESNGGIAFVQNATEKTETVWLVLADTADPDRVGTVPDPATSILEPPLTSTTSTAPAPNTTLAPAGGNVSSQDSTTSTSTTAGASAASPASDVFVDVSGTDQNIARDIGLRVLHIGAIGLWIIPIIAAMLGHRNRTSVVVALVGVGVTLTTGAILMLWGTPIDFPGMLNWRELADLSYGNNYLVSFAVKLLGALAAAGATIHWAWKMDRPALLVTLAGTAVAIVAVTAMSQFHLLSHF